MKDDDLIKMARQAQANAYAPYSNYKVGAAILGGDGQIYTGVNVENGSYGLTICAERSAVFKAVTAGCREFKKIVVYTKSSPPAAPCGACRQVLNEFSPGMEVICANDKNEVKRYTLSELLPYGFEFEKE